MVTTESLRAEGKCGVMIHTRGFELGYGPAYCSNPCPCPFHNDYEKHLITPKTMRKNIRDAYLAGQDKRKNGANTTNCNFRHFATQDQTRAWEAGEKGEPLPEFLNN